MKHHFVRSNIHKIGLFAAERIKQNAVLLEYVGEVIRNCLLDKREKEYNRKGLGVYFFKLDKNFTIDATLKGSVARFINHSCQVEQ